MNSLLIWMVETSIATAGLALIAIVICQLFPRRPAVRHLLWLIVLVRFVLLPILSWPVVEKTVRDDIDRPAQQSHVSEYSVPAIAASNPRSGTVESPAISLEPVDVVDPQQHTLAWIQPSRQFQSTILLVWFVGLIVGLVLQVARIRTCRRLLTGASSAPGHLLNEIQQLSNALGMRSVPVQVTSRYPSPFIWCFGWLRLVWPQSLSSHAGVRRSRSILAHELVHVRRRDHWVAWIELLASLIWWWNPVYWIVRHRLRESAEMACDAVALSALPDDRFAYAELFLELSSSSKFGELRPALGVSAGTPSSFERRLRMILSDDISGGLSRPGLCAALVLMGLAMPGLLRGEQKEFENTQHNTGKVIYLVDDDGDGIADRPAATVESEFINGDPGLGKIYVVVDEDAESHTKVRRMVTIIASRQIENGITIQTLGKLKPEAAGPIPEKTITNAETPPQDPPSPDEIIRALPDLPKETRRQNVKIVVELIRDHVDDWRHFPLVGPAQLHHRRYKCTVSFEIVRQTKGPVPGNRTEECIAVVYIDRDLLISKDKPVLNATKLSDSTKSQIRMDNAPDVELLPSTTNIAAAATNPETAANSESPKVIVGRVDVNITEIPPNKIKTAQVIGDVKWVDKTIHHWKAEIREKAVDAPLVDGKKPRPLKVVSMVPIPTTFKAAVYGTRCEFVLKDRKRTETESVSEASSDVTAKVLSSAIRKPRGLIGRDSTTGTVKWTVDLGDTFDDLKSWSIDGSTVTVKFHKAEPMFFDTNTGTRQEPPSDGKHDGAERSKIGVIW